MTIVKYRVVLRSLGCGYETCENEADLNQFNYLHPDFHPYEHGRDVHSLQSVTKSVAATAIGIALTTRGN